jgi:hypothetical protein
VCPFATPVPPPPKPLPPGSSEQAQVEATQLSVLSSIIGQYLRGDVPVYRGTIEATAVTAGGGCGPDQSTVHLPEGPALAMLGITNGSTAASSTATLIIHATKAKVYADLVETKSEPSKIAVGTLGGDDPKNGITTNIPESSCTACGPDLWDRPPSITLGLTAKGVVSVYKGVAGMGGKSVSVPVQTDLTAHLEVAKPCSLTWTDLAHLNTAIGPDAFSLSFGLTEFTSVGGDWVWHVEGSTPSGTAGECEIETLYSIDLYVNQRNLADYGVRNYQASSKTVCDGGAPP